MVFIRVGLVGLPATGKSSVLSRMSQCKPDYDYVEEPLQNFNTFRTVDNDVIQPLSLFYSNDLEAGYFQLHAIKSFEYVMARQCIKDTKEIDVQIWDRLPHEVDIFTNSLHSLGLIPRFGYELCRKELQNILHTKKFHLDGIYYIRTSPEECYNRIHLRHRLMEVQYEHMLRNLRVLYNFYESALNNGTGMYNDICPVLVSQSDSVEGRTAECLSFIHDISTSRVLPS